MAISDKAFEDAVRASLPGPQCFFARIRSALEPKELVALEAALANPAISHTVIARVLKENGHKISDFTVARHRKRECSCDP